MAGFRKNLYKRYCYKCDKKHTGLCQACIRIMLHNKDSVPIGYNDNHIEPVYDEY